MAKEVLAFGWAELGDEIADAVPERVHRALGVFAEVGFELREGRFDRVEVRRIGRQEPQLGLGRFDGFAYVFAFVRTQIVHDDDVAGRQRGDQNLFDIGLEPIAVHRPVQHHRRGQAADAQARREGGDFPMPVRDLAFETLASRASPARARHVGGAPGFIDEHQLAWIEPGLLGAPGLPRGRYVGTILLAGQHAFF